MGVKLPFLLSLGHHCKPTGHHCKPTGDERHLPHAVPFFHATHLTQPPHIDGFIAL